MTYNEIYSQILKKKSFLCVGLDSDPKLLPECLAGENHPIFAFNKAIIDATAPYAVAFKPNTAFYEASGISGWEQFEMTVRYIKENYPDIMVIADAKRGDIGNTAKRYAEAFFENLDCDAVTLAPYMGLDSVAPFLAYEGKWSIVLALTSNKSADDFETLPLEGGMPLHEKVMRTAMNWGSAENTMFVVGATRAEELAKIRTYCPDHFLLVPGVGAQGGTVEEVARFGLNSHCGLLVNSSRGIIFADKSERFAEVAAEKAREMAEKMAAVL
ncbi:MAG: orotidine-5'-phosphate decarboxylase [Bacteroidales bacterium]|nr:orotidine-5'-phosphate decarboxylase [Bacteroidales bacterium]